MIRIQKWKLEEMGLDVLLFCMSVRFLNKNNTFMLLFAAWLLFLLWKRRIRLGITLEGIILTAFGVLYCIFGGYTRDLTAFFSNGIGAVILYFAGNHILLLSEAQERPGRYRKYLFLIALGNVLFMILSYLRYGATIVIDRQYAIDNRYVGDFWTGELFYCTNFNSYGMFFCCVCFCILMQTFPYWWKLLTVGFTAFVILISAATGSRTNIFIFLLTIPGYFSFRWFCRAISGERSGKWLLCFRRRSGLSVLLICILAVTASFFGQEIWETLPMDVFAERFSGRDPSLWKDPRWEKWAAVISMIPRYPFGGMPCSWAHNLYLDVARIAGILPMTFCILFTVFAAVTAFGLSRRSILTEKEYLLGIMLISFLLLSFLIEPTMEAKPYIFMAYCFVAGMNRFFYRPIFQFKI